VQVIGVQTELCPSIWAALRGEKAKIGGESLAEGIAVKNVGSLTLPIVRKYVDDVVLVREGAIERAVAEYLMLQKTMAEGAGAAGLAAVISDRARFAGKKVGLVLAGGNIDPRLASSIMVRELAREEQVVAIRIFISDRPGVLGEIAKTIGVHGGNILEVSHRRTVLNVPPKGAVVEVTMETHGGSHAAEIVSALSVLGYRVEILDPPTPGGS
jgi:threonine dehydratase